MCNRWPLHVNIFDPPHVHIFNPLYVYIFDLYIWSTTYVYIWPPTRAYIWLSMCIFLPPSPTRAYIWCLPCVHICLPICVYIWSPTCVYICRMLPYSIVDGHNQFPDPLFLYIIMTLSFFINCKISNTLRRSHKTETCLLLFPVDFKDQIHFTLYFLFYPIFFIIWSYWTSLLCLSFLFLFNISNTLEGVVSSNCLVNLIDRWFFQFTILLMRLLYLPVWKPISLSHCCILVMLPVSVYIWVIFLGSVWKFQLQGFP